MKWLLMIPCILLLTACSDEQTINAKNTTSTNNTDTTNNKWYSASDIKMGQQIFTKNCATCHGDQAQGLVKQWRLKLNDGSYPAPPLNGTAHAWHHSLKALLRTTENGGTALGGTMPGFKGKLSQAEQLAAIAYFQSTWPDKIYLAWLERAGPR